VSDDLIPRSAIDAANLADALRQAADLIELTLGRTEGAPAPDGAA